MYSRTHKPYCLDEVIYITCQYIMGIPTDEIALEVKRSPEALEYKFIEYRDKKRDGSFGTKSVKAYQLLE